MVCSNQPTEDGRSPSEEWRVVPFAPDYIVSCHGRVRHSRVGAPILKGDTDPKGYRRVSLKGRHRRVARVVCEAFHGECPPGHECAHIDGDLTNNAASNLRWVTRSENTRHSVEHGTHFRANNAGEAHPCATLTEADVRTIRTLSRQGKSRREIAVTVGISKTQVHRILTGERWSHVK